MGLISALLPSSHSGLSSCHPLHSVAILPSLPIPAVPSGMYTLGPYTTLLLHEQEEAAAAALAELGPVLQSQQLLAPLQLQLQGLSHFRHQVRRELRSLL